MQHVQPGDYSPRSHRLDRFAGDIAVHIAGTSDELLTPSAAAQYLHVSEQWLASGRCRGWGPPFVKLSPLQVRYRRDDLIAWLNERSALRSTAEWRKRADRPLRENPDGRRPGRPRKVDL